MVAAQFHKCLEVPQRTQQPMEVVLKPADSLTDIRSALGGLFRFYMGQMAVWMRTISGHHDSVCHVEQGLQVKPRRTFDAAWHMAPPLRQRLGETLQL